MSRLLRVWGWLTEKWDWLMASDPGLSRLRTANAVAVGVATTLAVEYGFATILRAGTKGTMVSMMLGCMVPMIGMAALGGTGFWAKARTALVFPVALGSGMLAGAAVRGHTNLMLVVWVVVMFTAVAVRRFGPPFFFYGFMGWMGYFFASFIGATLAMVPGLVAAVTVAAVWALILSISVLRTNPVRTLHRMVHAFGVRARRVAQVCADLLLATEERQRARLRRRLHARQVQLAETALMVEAWSAQPGAVPPERSAPALRRRLINLQHALDRLAASADALAASDADLRQAAARVTERLAHRDDPRAKQAAFALIAATEPRPGMPVDSSIPHPLMARRLAEAALEFVELAQQALDTAQPKAGGEPEPIDVFQPVVQLTLGNLPGSPAVARDVPARGRRWNPFARLDLTTRQALQVAVAGGLAIVVGRAISPQRYYWAAIAAFVMFAGTATRTETFLKGLNRVVGTLVGLVAATWLANLTVGHTPWALATIVLSLFFGNYLMRISYVYMIFFITIMIGQMYVLLHQFSIGLLLLRLEETTAGAAVGFLVALVVVPLSTRDTIRAARRELLAALAELLQAAAGLLAGGTDARPDFDALTRSLDNRLRQLALVAQPLTRPFVWGFSANARHRLTIYAALCTDARALAVALRRPCPRAADELAAAAHTLALAAAQLSQAALADADATLLTEVPVNPGDCDTNAVIRPLLHIEQLLNDLTGTPADPL